jgi:geranylgeranyl reductase family protein
MTNSNKYDVIIAGGGPAGSTAGYILSRSGLKVMIIDRSVFPRHKLCGGCITDKTVKLLARVFGDTPEYLKDNGVINFESGQFEIFHRDHSILKKKSTVPFYFVERYVYDDYLLKKAQQAGAEAVTGDDIISYEISDNRIQTSSGRIFTGQFIIGADGVNSLIRKQFPLEIFDRKNWQKNAGAALEIFIDRSEMPVVDHPALYFDYIKEGYAWLFPNRDKFVAGIGGIAQKNRKQLLPAFSRFLSTLNLKNPGKYRVKGYTFPYGNYLLKPAFRNTLLVGDAAGFADPLLGEGIFYAQRSAELASQAISEAIRENNELDAMGKHAERQYVRLLQENIYTEFDNAKKIRNVLFAFLGRFHYIPLKIIMTILGSRTVEAVHGIRSYKWLKRKKTKE